MHEVESRLKSVRIEELERSLLEQKVIPPARPPSRCLSLSLSLPLCQFLPPPFSDPAPHPLSLSFVATPPPAYQAQSTGMCSQSRKQ